MEKIYKTMRNTGAASIAVVNGALLLKRKSEITF